MSNPNQFPTNENTDLNTVLKDAEVDVPSRYDTSGDKTRKGFAWKSIIGLGLVGVLAVGGGTTAGAVLSSSKVEIKEEAAIEEVAEAEVVHIETDMDVLPIRVALAETDFDNLFVNVNIKFEANILDIIKVELPGGKVEPEFKGSVEPTFNINPGKVSLRYSSEDDVLYADVADTGLSIELDSEVEQVDENATGWGWIKQNEAQFWKGLQSAYDEAFPDANNEGEDSYGRQKIKDEIAAKEEVRRFADLYIQSQVGEKCVPLIAQVPNFKEQVEENIATTVQGKILDKEEPNEVFLAMMKNPAIADLSLEEQFAHVQEVVERMVVNLPEDEAGYALTPDQKVIDELAEMTSEGIFEGALKDEEGNPIEINCAVNESVRIPEVEADKASAEGASNE